MRVIRVILWVTEGKLTDTIGQAVLSQPRCPVYIHIERECVCVRERERESQIHTYTYRHTHTQRERETIEAI